MEIFSQDSKFADPRGSSLAKYCLESWKIRAQGGGRALTRLACWRWLWKQNPPQTQFQAQQKGGKGGEEEEKEEEQEEEELNSDEAWRRNAWFRSLPPSPLGTHLSLPGDVTLA